MSFGYSLATATYTKWLDRTIERGERQSCIHVFILASLIFFSFSCYILEA